MKKLDPKNVTMEDVVAVMQPIPEEYRDLPLIHSLIDYIEEGRPTGGFLEAVIANDLFKAVSRADLENRRCIADYVKYLFNYAPMQCHGSQENYLEWVLKDGRKGQSYGGAPSWVK